MRFAAFDIDGTLIRWQLYHAMGDKLAHEGLLGKDAVKTLHHARMQWKLRRHPDAFSDYEKLLVDYFNQSLPKLSPRDFDRVVEEVIEEYKEQVYTYTRGLLRSLKAQGYFLVAISGSHQELVEAIATHYGFDYAVGTRYERSGDGFTGQQERVNDDKAGTLRRIAEKFELSFEGSYAVGDTASDAGMLELVQNPVAFNPDQKLFSLAKKHGWKIVVERKNVIYELEPSHGQHLLVQAD